MAASSNSEDDGMVSGINVTPLVDVCLVLMVILMVTARMIDQQSMPLDLPKAASGQAVQDQFSVNLHASGETDVDSKRLVKDDDLMPLAKEALAKNPELRTIIRADSSVPHGRVIHALDLLKRAGISKIAFGVTQTQIEDGKVAPGATPGAPTPPPAPAPQATP